MSQDQKSTYTGSCHCGQVKFSFQLPSPLEEQEVTSCNCSICQINGYLLVYPQTTDVTYHHTDDAVRSYTFATKRAPHYFCANCGSSVYIKNEIPGMDHMIAVRTVADIDIKSLKIKEADGKSY
ncbi:hypothetical protein FE257_004950 [Aspergillus nanangensis]|uniref:CENP-V/GFA domain-containing protein n=1 Tax=Aspergillus nanangensis TaxID=2582783 RepID=A0AAD4CAH2_ASPNN|nr:hypothetical protein FE257_004950 [Aspergillus nanangensis]